MSNTCCIRSPVAKLLATYKDGIVSEIRNVSEWNEQLYSMPEFRSVRWVLFLNGVVIRESEWTYVKNRQSFLGSTSTSTAISNGYALMLPNGREGVVSWLGNRVTVDDDDRLEVAIYVKNGDGNYSKCSNKVLLNVNSQESPCCHGNYVVRISGQSYCLVTKINNMDYCIVGANETVIPT